MLDCSNVTIRELLPDLLHDRLSAGDVARVEAHLASCAVCRAELDVLQTVRTVLVARPVPRIDTRAIVQALPRPTAKVVARPIRWRWAAAITLAVLGGTTIATTVRMVGGGGVDPVVIDTVTPVVPPVVATIDTPAATPSRAPAAVRMTAGGGIDDLADEDLEALIGALDRIELAPHAEPEASRHARWVSGSTGGN